MPQSLRSPASGSGLHVLVVDDHPLVLSGILSQLRNDAAVGSIDTAENGGAALERIRRRKPDVVVLDISLPDMSGLDVAIRLRAAGQDCAILFLTMHDEEEYVLRAVEHGARGYLLKSDAPGDLPVALRRVAAGETHFSPQVKPYLLKRYVAGARPNQAPGTPLTPREQEVLVHIAEGRTTKQIAAHLDLSARTVQTYRERMMKKLDLHSVADLTRYAIAEGLTQV